MNKNKVSNKKPYSPMKFLKDGIVIELILLYITLMIGDAISLMEDNEMLFTRYIPIGVVTLIATFFIIKNNSKKCTKADEEIIRRNIFIIPVIVAVILLCYGLYSVSVNVNEVKEEAQLYSSMFGEELVETMLDVAASEARESWLITTFTYLIVAEAVAFMTSKKINGWLKDDIVEDVTEPLTMEENKEESNFEIEEKTTNNIKWDL